MLLLINQLNTGKGGVGDTHVLLDYSQGLLIIVTQSAKQGDFHSLISTETANCTDDVVFSTR